ncbi:MAG TPA: response regulator [Candidatus Nitrosotalea sp.]|nr:response regulator [Candidatus Nitrosotalea sp.]
MNPELKTVSPKILVVDDEPYMLRFIQILLERDGYGMIRAGNGREAVEVAKRENPQLVIMDAMMPKMDGMAALKELKQDEATRSIPVIMLTANPHKFTREEAESLGATIFLTKPFSPTRLLSEVRRYAPPPETR